MIPRRNYQHLVLALIVGLALTGWGRASELILDVVTLRHRTAEQVLPVLQPLVPSPGTVTGVNNNLFIRTTPENVAAIRKAVAAIDLQPRRLVISVRHDADRRADSQTQVYGTQSLENDRSIQQIQVLEGNAAFIRVGQSVPVPTGWVARNVFGRRVVESGVDSVDYRDILSGFHVRPQLTGKTVTLEVTPHRNTPGNQGRGSMNVQELGTTVSGRLGEWMEIGGIITGRALDASGTAYRTMTASGDDRRVLIKVDELP